MRRLAHMDTWTTGQLISNIDYTFLISYIHIKTTVRPSICPPNKKSPSMLENINGDSKYENCKSLYNTFRTCSLICSRMSFIFTTMICISLWLLLLPRVLISRPISCAIKPNFLPTPALFTI